MSPFLLVSHGLGGGMEIDTRLGAAGFHVLAPSRFGYPPTPLPSDPSPEKQADAFATLLDERGADRADVLGVSAGALAALHLALRHPARVRSLVVVVPRFGHPPEEPLFTSDLAYRLALRVARGVMIRSVLGTDPFVVDAAPPDEQRRANDLLASFLPLRPKLAGVRADRRAMSAVPSIALERVEARTLVIATKDDLHRGYETARVLASRIPDARLVTYRTGGHAWIGRDRELFVEVLAFLAASIH